MKGGILCLAVIDMDTVAMALDMATVVMAMAGMVLAMATVGMAVAIMEDIMDLDFMVPLGMDTMDSRNFLPSPN